MLNVTNEYKKNVLAPIRQFNGRFTFNVPSILNNVVYGDDRIINIKILEEVSTLSDTIPSNECNIQIDNTDGAFNFLTFNNMQQIIASKPTMFIELGLVTNDSPAQVLTNNFNGKVTTSQVENPNIFWTKLNQTTLADPSTMSDTISQYAIDQVKSLDGLMDTRSTTTNGAYGQQAFSWNIIQILEQLYGTVIWKGQTTLSQKIALARTYISKFDVNWYGNGSTVSGNKANFTLYRTTTGWYTPGSHTNSTVTLITRGSSSMDLYIHSDGYIHSLAYSDPSNGSVASSISTDYCEIVLTMNPIFIEEWLPMGKYYLDNWKSDRATQTITLTGHDQLTMLSNIPIPDQSYTSLGNLAQKVFSIAGITDYSIDSSIMTSGSTMNVGKDLNARSVLQMIGIAGQCAVYQDRTGKMVIKPFPTLTTSNMYAVFASSQNGIFHTPFATNKPLINDDGGNRHIALKDMYDLPEVTLESSIYQLDVNIYNSTGTTITGTQSYTNSSIAGTNGVSFTIDNPLIKSSTQANTIANWYMTESNFNVVYKSNWRQNPCLESTDIVLFDDGIPVNGVQGSTQNRQVRIYKNEFDYSGSLQGVSEGRGGM